MTWFYAWENWTDVVYGDGNPDGPLPYPAWGRAPSWREAYDKARAAAISAGSRARVNRAS